MSHPKASQVHDLSRQGYSQSQIAAKTLISQPTVSRILAKPAPDGDDAVSEYYALVEAVEDEPSLDDWRYAHEAWKVLRRNGYDVAPVALRLLMALKDYQLTVPFGTAGYQALQDEIKQVYQNKRELG